MPFECGGGVPDMDDNSFLPAPGTVCGVAKSVVFGRIRSAET